MLTEEQRKTIEAIWLQIWDLMTRPIFVIKDAAISLSSITMSIAIFVLMLFIARALSTALGKALDRNGMDSGVRASLTKFTRYFLVALGIFFALDNLGVSITSFAAVGALLMVGIGFGLQNITQNFISGIIILIERPIKVGDIIRVGNASGRVMDIRVRSSIIETRDDVSIIVPNSKILAEEVISDTYLTPKTRQRITVGVSYKSDVHLVQDLLVQAAQEHSDVIKERPPRALLKDFGDSYFEFELRYWTYNTWQYEIISSDIRYKIIELFKANNIDLPYPQRDLHFKSPLQILDSEKTLRT